MTAANGRTIRRQRLRKVARIAADAQGCTCHPDITVGAAQGVDNVKVSHDSSCPLHMAGRFYVAYFPSDFGGCSR